MAGLRDIETLRRSWEFIWGWIRASGRDRNFNFSSSLQSAAFFLHLQVYIVSLDGCICTLHTSIYIKYILFIHTWNGLTLLCKLFPLMYALQKMLQGQILKDPCPENACGRQKCPSVQLLSTLTLLDPDLCRERWCSVLISWDGSNILLNWGKN